MTSFDDVRDEIYAHFEDLPTIYLSTSVDGQPRVRPVTLVKIGEDLYVFTSQSTDKVSEITSNPKAEFCVVIEEEVVGRGTVRVKCDVKVITDPDIKSSMSEKCAFFTQYWSCPEDPEYTLLKLVPTGMAYMPPGKMTADEYLCECE